MEQKSIPFTRSARSPNEITYIEEVLSSGCLQGDGPFTKRANGFLRHLVGSDALLTTSCTHALELMALLCNLGNDHEVVVPSYTFPSTANAVALRGAKVRFADVDPATWTMELPQLEAALTSRTRAVLLMPYGGVSRDLAAMVQLCEARGIIPLVDAAHSLFATHEGRPVASYGAAAALSFHGTKNISCGEGGAIIVNNPALLARANVVREKGTNRDKFLRGEIDKYTWIDVGSSWLPSELLAAVLCAQLEHADQLQAVRQQGWNTYSSILSPQAGKLGISLQHIPAATSHPAHVFAILTPTAETRARVIAQMRSRGFACVSHYEPLHLGAAAERFAVGGAALPVTEAVAARLLRLPLYSDMAPETAELVAQNLIDALENCSKTNHLT